MLCSWNVRGQFVGRNARAYPVRPSPGAAFPLVITWVSETDPHSVVIPVLPPNASVQRAVSCSGHDTHVPTDRAGARPDGPFFLSARVARRGRSQTRRARARRTSGVGAGEGVRAQRAKYSAEGGRRGRLHAAQGGEGAGGRVLRHGQRVNGRRVRHGGRFGMDIEPDQPQRGNGRGMPKRSAPPYGGHWRGGPSARRFHVAATVGRSRHSDAWRVCQIGIAARRRRRRP